MHICIYVYVYMYICVYVYLYISTYVYMYIHVSPSIRPYVNISYSFLHLLTMEALSWICLSCAGPQAIRTGSPAPGLDLEFQCRTWSGSGGPGWRWGGASGHRFNCFSIF